MCRKKVILFLEICMVTTILRFLAGRRGKIVTIQCMTTCANISKTKSANLLADYLHFPVLMLVFGLHVCLKESRPHFSEQFGIVC